ncbi:methyl-accepting chemotaxis protein [Rhizobium sp. HT1-10]|uniref:methyl-accepting chemotaxis protein n=1 Tax=Rhizobium sp. HT1-10 TaxID=3111638 RepID=UPI003C26F5C5
MIDRLMSRVRIQTKVLLLVTPFILCIFAVGLTGIYASRLLEGRMEVSNEVLQSLSGFKNVFSSMTSFLMKPSQETHDSAAAQAHDQIALLKQTADGLRATSDVALLDQALSEAATIPDKIEAIWQLQSNQEKIWNDIVANSATLLDLQGQIGKRSFGVMATAKIKDNANKAGLKNAGAINAAALKITALSADYAKASTPDTKAEIAQKYAAELTEALSPLETAISKDQPTVLGDIKVQLDALNQAAKASDPTQSAASADIAMAGLVAASDKLKSTANALMLRSVLDLAASDQEVSKAEGIGNKLRAIVNSNNEIRVVFAELVSNPDEASVKKVQQSIYMYGTEVGRLADLVKDDATFTEISGKFQPVLDKLTQAASDIAANSVEKQTQFAAAAAQIDSTWNLLSQFADSQKHNAGLERKQANSVSIGAMAIGVLIAMIAGGALVLTLKGPIAQITAAMRRIAEGVLETSIAGESRADEVGDMARALTVFKDNAISRRTMEKEAEANRALSEAERARNEADRREARHQIDAAIEALGQALRRMSKGELNFVIETPFAQHLDGLRKDFNHSIDGLRKTLVNIRNTSEVIHDNGQQMASAVNDLAMRTEKQAAALEETAAAVDEISSTVSTTSERSTTALNVVHNTKQRAEASAEIVKNAVSAMGRIKESSEKISSIVTVIDAIAFQTNLLALNAGVEAARAGDAGKGFAVVAQEVRELAQRSAQAAKEIAQLIRTSVDEVALGSEYVGETGNELIGISQEIIAIFAQIELIASSSSDQAGSLKSVTSSINEIDRMTQQNAAMVEETNAATRQLSDETITLTELVGNFSLDHGRALNAMSRAA